MTTSERRKRRIVASSDVNTVIKSDVLFVANVSPILSIFFVLIIELLTKFNTVRSDHLSRFSENPPNVHYYQSKDIQYDYIYLMRQIIVAVINDYKLYYSLFWLYFGYQQNQANVFACSISVLAIVKKGGINLAQAAIYINTTCRNTPHVFTF